MQIRVKLMGRLKAGTPAGGTIAVADGATIADVLRELAIAPESAQVVTVNGRFERDRTRSLAADDELTVVPPVAGG